MATSRARSPRTALDTTAARNTTATSRARSPRTALDTAAARNTTATSRARNSCTALDTLEKDTSELLDSDTSLEELAVLTSRRTSLTSLQEVTKCLDDVDDGNYAVHTSTNALKFRGYYSKYISDVPFGLESPDDTAIKTM
jgi:DNA repair ATPase RecN